MRKIRGVCGLDQELTTRNVYDLLVVKILNAVLVDTFSSEFSFSITAIVQPAIGYPIQVSICASSFSY